MKIIKPGKSKEELEAILKNEKQFECAICGTKMDLKDGDTE